MGDLFITAGADRIASVDLHTGQLQGFIDAPFDSLTALPLFTDYLKNKEDGPLTVVSPDSGGVKRATRFAHHLNAEVAFIYKRRRTDARNQVTASHVVGDIKDRHCIIVDDIIDTAGTVVAGAELLLARGAASVKVLATHGVLSGPAIDRLRGQLFQKSSSPTHFRCLPKRFRFRISRCCQSLRLWREQLKRSSTTAL